MTRRRTTAGRHAPASQSTPQVLVLTTPDCPPGQRVVQTFGYVSGGVVYSRNIGADLGAAVKNLVGGEIRTYSKLLAQARGMAMDRMMEEAAAMGANAILEMRLATSDVALGAVELYAYGTAVLLGPYVDEDP